MDLFELLRRDTTLRRAASTHGGEYAGACPWCGGSANTLYNSRAIQPRSRVSQSDKPVISPNKLVIPLNKPVILVEGELDALTIWQEAADLITPVATGSTSGARTPECIVALSRASPLLIAFDADSAGERASAHWHSLLPDTSYRWRPYWKDPNAMLQSQTDLRAWVQAGIAHLGETRRDDGGEMAMGV